MGTIVLAFFIAVSCNKKDDIEPQLAVNVTSLSIASEADSKQNFTISSNTNWTVSSSEGWLSVNPTSGSNDETVTVTAEQNSEIGARTATLTISANEAAQQTITVTQSGAGYNLAVSKNSLTIPGEENSTETFEITANTDWTLTSSESWLTFSPASGSGNETVTVTAELNPNTTERKARITVSTEETASQTIAVTQSGSPCVSSDGSYCDDSGCAIPTLPTYSSLTANSYLPDPFMFMDGSRVTSKAEWECRRAEIAALAQKFEYGFKPCTPKDATTGSFSENEITVTVTDNGKTISFTCTITYPSSGSAPYPAIIGVGGSFLDNDLLSSLGVAVINFPNTEIAEQNNTSSRGKGKFYDLYCSDHSAGALVAWSWGVSRLIDALETTPEANIDPERLGVTGCSRNGKGALAVGAFEERIALTIPQESGSGGSASWRVSDAQQAEGQNVQTLSQIVGENVWFRADFSQFSNSAEKLPYDHHMVEALVAPRALLVVENTSMEWLGNQSTWATANAAHKVWEALGVPEKMGFTQVGHGSHCVYPAAQKDELTAYIEKFLVGTGTGNTSVMSTDGNFTFDEERWINWTVPSMQ